MPGRTVEKKCKQCGSTFTARLADVKRGWGKFCSKSCKAKKQESRTGQYAAYKHQKDLTTDWRSYDDEVHPFDPEALGQS